MDQFNFIGSVTDYQNYLITEQIEENLYAWLSWSLLGIGAFENVTLAESGVYGGDKSRLQPLNDPRHTKSTIWQGNRMDWCWESGISYSTQPIQISGVYINNTFLPNGSTGNPFYVNYNYGQVVFSSAIPATSVVQIEHSPKFVTIKKADDLWFKSIMNGSLRVDDLQFTGISPSGQWNSLPENRVNLPVLVIEPVFNGRDDPFELGNTSKIHQEDFLIHTITETPSDKKRLTSLLKEQMDKRIVTFDCNEIDFPLNAYGTPISGALTYPELCDNHPWRQIRIQKVNTTDQESIGNKIYWTTTRYTLEIDAP